MSAILHYRYIISYSPAKSKHFFGQCRCRRGKAAFDSPCRAPVRPAGRFGPAETGGLRPPRPPPSPGEGGRPALRAVSPPPESSPRTAKGAAFLPPLPFSCHSCPVLPPPQPKRPGSRRHQRRRAEQEAERRPGRHPGKRPGTARRTTGSSAGSPRTPSLPLLYFLFLGRFFRTEKPKEPTFLPRAKYSPWE